MIRNIQLRHAGKYTCAVQTKVDSVSIATDVVVRGKDVLHTACLGQIVMEVMEWSAHTLAMHDVLHQKNVLQQKVVPYIHVFPSFYRVNHLMMYIANHRVILNHCCRACYK